MPSIKTIVLSLALAAAVSAQGASQITDGQIQVPTALVPLSTAPAPTATVYSTGNPAPTSNGTFITGVPAPSASAFPGAGNMLSWSKEVVIGAAGVAVGLALL